MAIRISRCANLCSNMAEATDQNEVVHAILALFGQRGERRYGTEAVTQTEHALQAAQLAAQSGAASPLIAAALLHDIGHLLDETSTEASRSLDSLDDRHEVRGQLWLSEHFTEEVTEPIRLHVPAKRYLCSVDPAYAKELSPTSYQSFLDQGGRMSNGELEAFAAEKHCDVALQLRRWDDQAKVANLPTPPIEDYVDHLRTALATKSQQI